MFSGVYVLRGICPQGYMSSRGYNILCPRGYSDPTWDLVPLGGNVYFLVHE